jgi:undecaprenyl-diphosphatase
LNTRRRLGRLDRQLLAAAIRGRSPVRDRIMTTASGAANRSMVWVAVAGVLTATGRRRPRTAAASGLMGIGIAATLVNGPLKFAWQRERPATDFIGSAAPLLPLPRTFSFPSGHSASAFAFATGVTSAMPVAGPVVVPMAATVAYSRVHTGVHFPSDVAVGATIGVASGLLGARIAKRIRARSVHHPESPTLDRPIPDHVVFLTSENSGSADDFDAARKTLEDGGWRVDEVIDIENVERLTELVEGGGADLPLVIAAGGDGTVCMAVNAIAESDALLAIVPLGTSNDVARSLGIPPNAVEAARAILDGRVTRVDAASVKVGDGTAQIFLNAATAGLNVEFASMATDGTVRDQFGGLTYPIAAARALRSYEAFECTLEFDGEQRTVPAVHLSVSNAPVFGGLLGFRVPGASMTDGLLDVIAVESLSVARLVLAVADAAVGQHRPVHGVHAMRVKALTVRSAPGQDIALDGEVIGQLPAEFRALPDAIRVVVPRI